MRSIGEVVWGAAEQELLEQRTDVSHVLNVELMGVLVWGTLGALWVGALIAVRFAGI